MRETNRSVSCIDIHTIICIIPTMRFTWFEPKRLATLYRRGLDFADAELVLPVPPSLSKMTVRTTAKNDG